MAGDESSGARFDDVDASIIGLLQQDGRRTYTDIAQQIGLSEPATRQRVNRMRQSGLLQIVAVTDPLRLGFRRMGMIGLRVRGEIDPVAKAMAEIDEIEYILVTAGAFDIMIEVVCKDDDELLRLLNRIRRLPGVESTETFMYLRIHKQSFEWGGH